MAQPSWQWENVPVPEPHLAALAVAALGHWLLPARLPLGPRTAAAIGGAVLGVGIGLATWAVRSASSEEVAIDRPTRLVTTGAYAACRNPMYQGWTMAVAGLAVALRSGWLLTAAAVAAARTQHEVVAEEATLEREFGDAYRDYARATPRYLGLHGLIEAVARADRMIVGGSGGPHTGGDRVV